MQLQIDPGLARLIVVAILLICGVGAEEVGMI